MKRAVKTQDEYRMHVFDSGTNRERLVIEKRTWKMWRGEVHSILSESRQEFSKDQVFRALWLAEREPKCPECGALLEVTAKPQAFGRSLQVRTCHACGYHEQKNVDELLWA